MAAEIGETTILAEAAMAAIESPVLVLEQFQALDRRRAGRQDVSPTLVPLLRDPAGGGASEGQHMPAETPYRDFLENDPLYDQLAPARGIALGLAISMLFWGLVGYTIFR